MGALADLYSYLDGKKRALSDAVANPMLALEQAVSKFGEDNKDTQNLFDNAYPLPGYGTVLNTPEQIAGFRQRAAEAATNMAVAGTFIGPAAKTWNAEKAAKAQQMAEQGVDARAIWPETGTWRAPDGAWRQEVSDHGSTPGNRLYSWGEGKDLDQGNFTVVRRQKAMLHPELSAAYPETKKMSVFLNPRGGSSGAYEPEFNQITTGVGKDGVANQSTMLHELQHAIQQLEGFASGGSKGSAFVERNLSELTPLVDPQSIYKSGAKTKTNGPIMVTKDEGRYVVTDGNHRYADALKRGDSTIQTHLDPSFFDGYGGSMDQAVKDAAYENYRRLAGEAEARATEARRLLDTAQRRALFPEDSYDVPIDELIIRR